MSGLRFFILSILFFLCISAVFSSPAYSKNKDLIDKEFKEMERFYNNDAHIQYLISYCYYHGKCGAYKNYSLGAYYLKKSAKKHGLSQYILGVSYKKGLFGITKNGKLAIKYLKKSARQNIKEPIQILSVIYSEGLLGVKPNKYKAQYWTNKLRAAIPAKDYEYVRKPSFAEVFSGVYRMLGSGSNSNNSKSIQVGPLLEIEPNAYGLGVHSDQYGRPVKVVPAY